MEDRAATQTEAIVIRTFPFSEADLVVHVLSSSHGKMSLMAKSARKSRKRFTSCPDIFDRGKITFRKGRGSMPLLLEFTAQKQFRSIREDILKISAASLVCECMDFMVKEESEGQDAAFELLSAGLKAIDEAADQRAALRAAYQCISRLLEISGFGSDEKAPEPGLHSLLRLLQKIEGIIERELKTKDSLVALIRATL